MLAIGFDERVTRVTQGGEGPSVKVRELEVGDEFTYGGVRYRLVIEKVPFNRCDHEKYKQSSHAIVTEALPHLGKKQSGQSVRMTEERFIRIH